MQTLNSCIGPLLYVLYFYDCQQVKASEIKQNFLVLQLTFNHHAIDCQGNDSTLFRQFRPLNNILQKLTFHTSHFQCKLMQWSVVFILCNKRSVHVSNSAQDESFLTLAFCLRVCQKERRDGKGVNGLYCHRCYQNILI